MPSPMKAINETSTESRRPDPPTAVEVYIDDVTDVDPGWYFGILREWAHFKTYGWTATVQWSVPGPHGHDNRLDRFHAQRVREDTVDRSHGRDPGYRPGMTATPQDPADVPEVETGSAPQPIPTPGDDRDSEPLPDAKERTVPDQSE